MANFQYIQQKSREAFETTRRLLRHLYALIQKEYRYTLRENRKDYDAFRQWLAQQIRHWQDQWHRHRTRDMGDALYYPRLWQYRWFQVLKVLYLILAGVSLVFAVKSAQVNPFEFIYYRRWGLHPVEPSPVLVGCGLILAAFFVAHYRTLARKDRPEDDLNDQ